MELEYINDADGKSGADPEDIAEKTAGAETVEEKPDHTEKNGGGYKDICLLWFFLK